MMNRKVALLLLMVVPGLALAQQSFPVSDLAVDGIYASKVGEPDGFCLLGANFCLLRVPNNAWNHDALIDSWLAAHPKAVATRVSSHAMLLGGNRPAERQVYVWIEDGTESLNVELARQGRYVAAAMVDMVEADRQQVEMNSDPRFAQLPEELENERAGIPEENRPHRLVSEADYAEKMQRIARAESAAKQEKKGMWSDSGLKGRSPPKDDYLIKQYREHRQWFYRIPSLVHEDPRLAAINREPKTWAFARSAGVPQRTIDEYVDLLTKLDANEQLINVVGTGEICLVVADIIYGLFDNGVIKGYVFSPSDPHPLVGDLENWPSDIEGATTAFRVVADQWYLFEVHH
jgi:hypothetical protein